MNQSVSPTSRHAIPQHVLDGERLTQLALFGVGGLLLLFSLLVTVSAHAQGASTLQPGDQLMLVMPGEDDFNKQFSVNRAGNLLLPEIGDIHVEGLTLAEAKTKVKEKLSKSFRDLSRFRMTLEDRRLLVKVLGYVKQPGDVELPGDGTVQMALFSAGGLKAGAQMDQMQVRRGSKTIDFDYKRYLDTGDLDLLPELLSKDVIFVPASPLIGNVQVDFDATTLRATGDAGEDQESVKIFGEVRNPGTFSLKDDQTIVDLLMRAGGVTRFANVQQIRVIGKKGPKMFDLKGFLDTGDRSKMPRIIADSTIYVPKEETDIKAGANTIHIIGAVNRPGRHEFTEGMNIVDVVADAGGPSARADIAHIQIMTRSEEGQSRPVDFDMDHFLIHGGNLNELPEVRAGYTVIIPELPQDPSDNKAQWVRQSKDRSIYVLGHIGSPGRYMFNTNLGFLDIIGAANGPTGGADIRNIRITHRNEGSIRISRVNLARFFETGDESIIPSVKPGDVIFIPGVNGNWLDFRKEETVRLIGAVGKAGRYRFEDQMTILDLLAEAGGPRSDAMLDKIVVVQHGREESQARVFDLDTFARSGDYSLLPTVRAGDTIFIPSINQSTRKMVMDGIRDILQALSFFIIARGL